MENYGGEEFFLLRKYIECELYDAQRQCTDRETMVRKLAKKLKDEDSNYAFRATFDVDAGGELTEVTVDGSAQKAQEQYQIEKALYNAFEYDDNWDYVSEPSDVTAVFAITQENLDAYMTDNSYDTWMYAVALSDDSTYIMLEWGLVLLVGAAAFVIALNKGLRIWDWKSSGRRLVWCCLCGHILPETG